MSHYDLAAKEYSILLKCFHSNIVRLYAGGPNLPLDCRYLIFEYADCYSLNESKCGVHGMFTHV